MNITEQNFLLEGIEVALHTYAPITLHELQADHFFVIKSFCPNETTGEITNRIRY